VCANKRKRVRIRADVIDSLLSVYAGHTLSINSDNFESNGYTVQTYNYAKFTVNYCTLTTD